MQIYKEIFKYKILLLIIMLSKKEVYCIKKLKLNFWKNLKNKKKDYKNYRIKTKK